MKLKDFLKSKEKYDKILYNGESISGQDLNDYLDNEIEIVNYQDYDGTDDEGKPIILEKTLVYIKNKKPKKTFKIDAAININNQLLFEKNGYNYSIKYKCVLCKKEVNLAHCTSNNGELLICNGCAYKYFGNINEIMKWRKLKSK